MKKLIAIILTAMLAFSAAAVAGPRKKADLKEVTFAVHLHCENCVKKVQENVAFERGVFGGWVARIPVQAIARTLEFSKSPTVTIAGGIGAVRAPGERILLLFSIIFSFFKHTKPKVS